MLEKLLTERRRGGLFGPHLDSFITTAAQLGYARSTVREQLRLLDDFERWLERKSLALADLEEHVVNHFLENRRRKGRRRKGAARTVVHFLEHLCEKGAIQSPATFMGHIEPQSTEVYLTISSELLQQANARFHQHFGQQFDEEAIP